MGVERAVIRWYAQRQVLLEELDSLNVPDAQEEHTSLSQEEQQQQAQKRAELERRLRQLGPCPMPMMG
ncbi:MAG TPA: hypothetical protein DHW02_11735 [Ktedonobacter sp.]|nr:hypothetical protein [Ktedonobacter sp.]